MSAIGNRWWEGWRRRQTGREANALLFLPFVFLVFDIIRIFVFLYFVFLVFEIICIFVVSLYYFSMVGGVEEKADRERGKCLIVSPFLYFSYLISFVFVYFSHFVFLVFDIICIYIVSLYYFSMVGGVEEKADREREANALLFLPFVFLVFDIIRIFVFLSFRFSCIQGGFLFSLILITNTNTNIKSSVYKKIKAWSPGLLITQKRKKLILARLGVSRTIYVNEGSPNPGFPYFLGGYQWGKKTTLYHMICIFVFFLFRIS